MQTVELAVALTPMKAKWKGRDVAGEYASTTGTCRTGGKEELGSVRAPKLVASFPLRAPLLAKRVMKPTEGYVAGAVLNTLEDRAVRQHPSEDTVYTVYKDCFLSALTAFFSTITS
ncbi:unnamed protein product [Pleuronectes platessa]|uniref:Uncharacterized protein n=1 Tax=Pleuronectes platessa TaxID=8262 RepID=A0A9N7TUK6_PLEPL|nr:unnamed protein product [Pleuronectes platessa]